MKLDTSVVLWVSRVWIRKDKDKIAAMLSWPQPTSVKFLRGLLGLAGYYRQFIQNFGYIAEPLNALLRKEAFQWTDKATKAFIEL